MMFTEKIRINNVKGRTFRIFGWFITFGFAFNIHRD
jgi:hypothetical protein